MELPNDRGYDEDEKKEEQKAAKEAITRY